MIRNTRMYRRLWYIKKRRITGIRVTIILTLIIFILTFLAAYAQNRVFPYMQEVTEQKARTMITGIVSEKVVKDFGGKPGYDDIVLVEKDAFDRVTAIRTNVARLNLISANISEEVQKRINEDTSNKVGIPLGALFGDTVFSAEGPMIYVKFVSNDRVETEFISEFTKAALEQTVHSIKLKVKVKLGIIAPFMENQREVSIEIPFAETVIVGNIKNSLGDMK